MAIHDSKIRVSEVGETLRQAHSLAMLISTSDQAENSVRDAAMLQIDLIERAMVLLGGQAVPA